MSHMSVLVLYWMQAKVERKDILGRKACMRKVTAERKRSMHTCMEYLATLGLGFFQYTIMVGDPKMYKYRYLGLIGRGRGGYRGSQGRVMF
jgi:hypothetical protein